ncbi:riboflavin biosynthesis protein RibD (plasmid) [Legionella adelaidensis]|uniref:Riboflavin biosynthesis protein RibD n=1 Tax=Legionella adelaidensis TaxID=45056 RepID=A0A0W0R442_9GAMM|nr:bifunctional diaminohydroxyphosphoribosylaminopyrimidine deaminase/5-amino-6-(5-phosphoribosylamino)uracil reductase RibD [Legionella adelaidensis]KTC65810.1 riboflavin biosynthesis protein RibD [Legionella adelaidensis]VEH85238.1 riboflavin biosynthesis protein RibD [Legionella adelaidensis]
MHKRFLLAALKQAWLGRGICAPNPSVGAVAVQNGKIIAQAHHKGAGTPHAEQLLLSQLPAGLSDVTLYITLEPCNHWGKTPPCVKAIISYGVRKVVYGYADPNPLVAENNSPQHLLDAGIEVVKYPLREINNFYASYHYWTKHKTPWVVAKIAQSIDGKIAGYEGERMLLSNTLCNQFTHQKRLHADIILTTAATLNNDNSLLNVRLPYKEAAKTVAIIDSHAELNPSANIFFTAKHCHIFTAENLNQEQRPNCTYYPMPTKNEKIDLSAILHHLGHLGFHDVWVEAGAKLFNSLHEQQLVQQTYIYIAPTIVGTKGYSLYEDNNFFTRPHKVEWLKKGNNVIASLTWENKLHRE